MLMNPFNIFPAPFIPVSAYFPFVPPQFPAPAQSFISLHSPTGPPNILAIQVCIPVSCKDPLCLQCLDSPSVIVTDQVYLSSLSP